MTIDFTKCVCFITCNMPEGSASRSWQSLTTNSADNKQLNVLGFIWRRFSDRPARDLKSTSCNSAAPLNLCPDAVCHQHKTKRFSTAQLAMYLSADKTVHVECKNKITTTEKLEVNLRFDDEAVTGHRENEIDTSSLSHSIEVGGDELTYPQLSRSQKYWLSIGEIIGAWLAKKKHRQKSRP